MFTWGKLKPHLGDSAVIVAGTCYAASGSSTGKGSWNRTSPLSDNAGIALLRALAKTTGAVVIGGVPAQVTWKLDPPVVVVQPDGRMRAHYKFERFPIP